MEFRFPFVIAKRPETERKGEIVELWSSGETSTRNVMHQGAVRNLLFFFSFYALVFSIDFIFLSPAFSIENQQTSRNVI